MCIHVPNAQASIRAACCKKWFDCTQCHQEQSDHELFKTMTLIVGCKSCKKVFKKDLSQELEDADEYCPHCDNQFVIEAVEAKPMISIEGDDPRMIKDARMPAQRDLNTSEIENKI